MTKVRVEWEVGDDIDWNGKEWFENLTRKCCLNYVVWEGHKSMKLDIPVVNNLEYGPFIDLDGMT